MVKGLLACNTYNCSTHCSTRKIYFIRFKKVGTLDWARPFPADASSTSRANEGPASSALPWPMAYRPWALTELTRRRPFVDTGRLVAIHRKLQSDRVTADCGKAFLLFLNGGRKLKGLDGCPGVWPDFTGQFLENLSP